MSNVMIPSHLFSYFKQCGFARNYRSKDMILLESDDSNQIILITDGRVRVYCSTPSGKELTLEIVEKGRLLGESSLQNGGSTVAVCAVTEVSLIRCSIQQLYSYILQSEELLRLIFQHLTQTNTSLTKHIKRTTLYNSRQKVASFLLDETAIDNPERGIVNQTLPYTHEELSVCLGLNRITVTRILEDYKKQGFITTAYKKITVCNYEQLNLEFIKLDWEGNNGKYR